jgi:hypothetical protein
MAMSINVSLLADGQRACLERPMQFVDRDEGGYRIHAEATCGGPGDGYVAKVVISRSCGTGVAQETFRDEALAGGYRWPTAAAALCFALGKGRTLIAMQMLEEHEPTPSRRLASPSPLADTEPAREPAGGCSPQRRRQP